MKITLKKCRLAFPQIWEAKGFQDGGEPRFSAIGIIEPEGENLEAIRKAVKNAAEVKWKDKAKVILNELEKKGRVCYDTSPKTSGNGEPYAGFEGHAWVSAANKQRPRIVDRDKTDLVQADGRPYGGCYVNLVIDTWAQDNKFGKRVNATLLGVQFVADGEAFSGGAAVTEEDFEEIEVDAEAAEFI
jgi:hypothetical protein